MTVTDAKSNGDTTSFGFRDVPVGERQGLVNGVFATVAERYDLMNDLMSGGMHRLWKDDFVGDVSPPARGATHRFIDVAGGTADVALRLLRRLGPAAEGIVCDISPDMLAVGQEKARASGLAHRLDFVVGNAEVLPFPDRTFDTYTIAFGIRNVTRIDKALAEARRVLKTGGRFLCLEFSRVDVPVLDRLYDLHAFEVIPRLGALTAGSAAPYQYLVESIKKFPPQERFAGMLRDAGLAQVRYRNILGGVAAIHSGWRI